MRFAAIVITVILCPFAAGMAAADEAGCKPVRDAMLAKTAVKYDDRIRTEVAGRKPTDDEEIYTLDATYRRILGRWLKTPTSPQRELQGERSVEATFTACRSVGKERITDQSATIYVARIESHQLIPLTNAMKIWISDKTHLPLRIESDTDVAFLGRSHTTKLYRYGNVRPPDMSY